MLVSLFKKLGIKFSLNDPQWGRGSQDDNNRQNQNNGNNGKKPEDGPPDLDQLWRDFNQRLSRLFGKRGGGGSDNGDGGGFNRGDIKGAGIGAGVIAVIVAFLWLASGFFIVQEGQTAVVMTFGKYSHTTLPGFNWRWPYPLQSHEIVNVSQVRTAEIGYRSNAKNKQLKEALMLTDDENIIDIQFAVQYKLKNAAEWLFNNRDQDETVRQVAETAIREIVGRSKMDFVLYEGREKVALDVGQLMQQILDRYKSGVQITNVTMQGVQPPEQVQAAFDDAVKAGQDRERQKNEGQAYANDVIPKASGASSRLLEEAEAYRSRIVANAEGDAARFKQVLEEYQKAPAVTRDRMYLETMQQIFSNTTKVMVDAKSGNNLLYLPLDKLIQQSDNAAAAAKPATAPAGSSSAASPTLPGTDPVYSTDAQRDSRNRDARDSRDREVR
ncbi:MULTISPECIES: FtsH protease activity modulator HflK [unclassified Herbaspirillum]|jgi:membrane protease subunit HflK|uniref:FtsH protease activity modulator HflK n=1 Tax=unclassified Herbaspirillum TaxID=2624150 RepID=UPI000E2ECA3D|nr:MULTISPECIES: FtsH protease activity modulator HflK [unclassified Herbaspirillum]RFB68843.1 FtsH protease activity modulator HflK [Herbaspirillum sp. 3R-3a1]TFI05749.1 FtsH protease activity modulator HflK [Herbaspirillum sp. 3R11]TFI13340.1 FtsH protease activity modulator HflK [Herbaspirillum sp. 3R-11]TFI23974.1 FtsH protease activity modulator HflK [Herbaspirillum sp. 3C11]